MAKAASPQEKYTGFSKLPRARCDECPLKGQDMVLPQGDGEGYIAIVGGFPEVIEGTGEGDRLLHRILTELDADLTKVYYTHAVMCQVPPNRSPREPTLTEIGCCRRRLIRELRDVGEQILMPLGKWANQSVVGKAEDIRKARGKPEYLILGKTDHLVMSSIDPVTLIRDPADFPDLCFDIERALGICNGEAVTIAPPIKAYKVVKADDRAGMIALLKILKHVDAMSIDLETDGLRFYGKDIVTCALSWDESTVAFDWGIFKENDDLKGRFAKRVKRIKCEFHNGPFDIPWLRDEGIFPNYDFDTMLGSYVLDERSGIHGLERLAISHYKAPTYKFSKEDIKDPLKIPRDDLLIYNAIDADYTHRLTGDLRAEMTEDEFSVMDNLALPAAEHFTDFFMTGMLVNQERLEKNGRKWERQLEELDEEIRQYPGASDVNPNSPKQVSKFLFETLGLRKMGGGKVDKLTQAILLEETRDVKDEEAQEYWKTQSSKMVAQMSLTSTNAYMLYWLAQQHDYPRLMVKHRLLAKKHGTYYGGLKESMWEDGRMRPSYRHHGTVTGRQSSSDPSIHGTPKDKFIKMTYIADPGFRILYGDFPQAEIRMVGHYANDKKLIAALNKSDIHRAIAIMLFRLTENQYDALPAEDREKMRRAAKTIAFGIIYGRTAKGLAPQLGVSVYEAQEYINRFFDAMPAVKLWIAYQRNQVLIDHEVSSIFHRRRRFPLILNKRQRAEIQRQAVNMPIQSSVSDMTLLASIATCSKFDDLGIRYMRWPQIHDSFMVVVEEGAIREAGAIMKAIMEDVPFETDVPFSPVEIKCGKSWGTLKSLEEALA